MLEIGYKSINLQFKFNAGTSRGWLTEKKNWLIAIGEKQNKSILGIGEAGPLTKLSIDDVPFFEMKIKEVQSLIERFEIPNNKDEVDKLVQSLGLDDYPSLEMALETALLDLLHGGNHTIFPSANENTQIPINGLIWMGEKKRMIEQIDDKLAQGFSCIKLKIGSINFAEELEVLKYARSQSKSLILRVDANGAYDETNVNKVLQQLSELNIHSIEQPIKAGNVALMSTLCKESPVPIALDEELIGIAERDEKEDLLRSIKPQYIILKPTLLGGFRHTDEWISLADKHEVGWWTTSALESNIGLNAIYQYTIDKRVSSYQGLGTGQLYHNNILSPLEIGKGYIQTNTSKVWQSFSRSDFKFIEQ